MEPGDEEELLARRERLRHVEELAEAATAAAAAIAPDEGEGAASLAALAERALAPLERIAPELGASAEELRDLGVRLREVGSDLHRFVASLDAEPGALERVEERLQAIADLRRRFGGGVLRRAAGAGGERRPGARRHGRGRRPGRGRSADGRASTRSGSQRSRTRSAGSARTTRSVSPRPSPTSSRRSAWARASSSSSFESARPGRPEATRSTFLIRPNAGLPFAPVADTASGGELSRIALALAAVAGGETLVFDEIDAGIGGVTAHAVAATLQRLAERAQVLTITHLPQIASVADTHFRVEKVPGDPTHTRIEELDDLLRREEIERMAGGAEFIATLTEG